MYERTYVRTYVYNHKIIIKLAFNAHMYWNGKYTTVQKTIAIDEYLRIRWTINMQYKILASLIKSIIGLAFNLRYTPYEIMVRLCYCLCSKQNESSYAFI